MFSVLIVPGLEQKPCMQCGVWQPPADGAVYDPLLPRRHLMSFSGHPHHLTPSCLQHSSKYPVKTP